MNLLGFHTFLTHKHYGARPARHFDAYRMSEGWYFVEVGSWTLEIETPQMLRSIVRRTLAGTAAFSLAMVNTGAGADAPVGTVMSGLLSALFFSF
jgi:hypothetical protein